MSDDRRAELVILAAILLGCAIWGGCAWLYFARWI
jgi:hypothetical protein